MSVQCSSESFQASLKLAKSVDVVVVGGGPAGCVAALSAARNGARVMLIERVGYLGGMMTGGGIGGIGINGYIIEKGIGTPVVKGISLEILHRIQAIGGAPEGSPIARHPTDSVMMTSLLDEMMEEAGVELLFNTVVFDTLVEDGRLKGVAIGNKSGGQVVLADVVIDASADADVAAWAGAPFHHGREEDGRHHGGSMDMQIGGIDVDRLIDYLRNQPLLSEEERAELDRERSELMGGGRPVNTYKSLKGETLHAEPVVQPTDWDEVDRIRAAGGIPKLRLSPAAGGPIPGKATAPKVDGKYVPLPAGLDREWVEYIKAGKVPLLYGATEPVYPPPRFGSIGIFRHGKMRDGQMMSGVYEVWYDHTNEEEVSKSLIYRRKLNRVYLNFLRERIPGFEEAYIVMESPTGGAREGRRIVGDYILTEDDVLSSRRFPDVIAKGGPRGPDLHSVTGLWGDGVASPFKAPYDIPYRILLPKDIEGLLVAGRCVSATFAALGAVRDQATCMSMGEAAGAAASIAVREGVTPRQVDVRTLQQRLLDQGALLYIGDEQPLEMEPAA
ncbi:MAG: FAD-dependent oxidoreductase [Alphaproteobacteria bacterium]|nr:FAD-dependent oxidoreductase [Alphaproteobacteria bacterium]MBU0792543.1 FAD-dependent oxidoreductase [Alphaproteobacteria bacterium]MBU0874752.1 FAD-dependent oxidoreductase [Alphaproteobacteria bacterium]MBU1768610.1 FAD-dependent oxidoreductase [Alphaproteobacteria bacterium]